MVLVLTQIESYAKQLAKIENKFQSKYVYSIPY